MSFIYAAVPDDVWEAGSHWVRLADYLVEQTRHGEQITLTYRECAPGTADREIREVLPVACTRESALTQRVTALMEASFDELVGEELHLDATVDCEGALVVSNSSIDGRLCHAIERLEPAPDEASQDAAIAVALARAASLTTKS